MKRGFTLLELLVATVIFSLVLTATYALFDSARTLSDRAEARAAVLQEARTVLDTLKGDLQGVSEGDFVGSCSGTDDAPDARLEFTTVNHPTFRSTLPESDRTKTSYFISDMRLVRRKQTRMTAVNTSMQESEGLETIGPNVLYVKFRYYHESLWMESWDSRDFLELPTAVEVTLYMRVGEEEREKFTEKIYLPIAAETPPDERT